MVWILLFCFIPVLLLDVLTFVGSQCLPFMALLSLHNSPSGSLLSFFHVLLACIPDLYTPSSKILKKIKIKIWLRRKLCAGKKEKWKVFHVQFGKEMVEFRQIWSKIPWSWKNGKFSELEASHFLLLFLKFKKRLSSLLLFYFY